MDQAELESLVIRLVGDVSGYVKAMDQAVKHTEDAAAKIEHAAEHIEKFHQRLGEWAEKAEKGLLKVGLVIGAWEAFEKADEAEANMRHLEAMIELNEKSTHKTVDEYKKFSAEISKVTMLSKGETLAILQKAEAYRLTSEQTQKITKDAIALSNIPGVMAGPEGLLRITAAMAKGNAEEAMEMSRRMLPMLRTVKDEAEFATEYTKLLSAGLNIAKGDAEDATGQLTKMKQALGGVAKEIGENLAVVIDPAISAFSRFFKLVTFGNETFRGIVITTLTLIAAIPVLTSVYGYLIATKTVLIARIVAMTAATQAWIFSIGQATFSLWGMSTAAVAARGGLVALTVAGVVVLVSAVIGLRRELEKANHELERNKKLTEDILQKTGKRFDKQVEEATGSGQSQQQRLHEIEKLRKETDQELLGAEKNLNSWKKIQEDFNTTGNPFEWMGKQLSGGSEREANTQQVTAAQSSLDALRERIAKLKEQEEKIKEAGNKAANEYIQNLQLETTLMGMSKEEAELYKMTLAGLNDEKRQEVINAQEANRLREMEIADRKTINGLIEDLEMKSYGFDEEQMSIYKLAMAGASQETIDYARSLQQGIDAQKEWDDYLEEASQLTEKYKDPMLKRLEAQDRYNQMLKDGVISIETYNAAMDALIEKTHEANDANKQAALSGSQEALSRIAAYQDLLRTPIRGTDGASARGGLVPQGGIDQSPADMKAEKRGEQNIILLEQIRDRLQSLLDSGGLLLTPGA